MSETVTIKFGGDRGRYDIAIGGGLLAGCGNWAASSAPGAGRLFIISNKKVFSLYGAAVVKGLRKAGFETAVHLIGDGERFKNLKSLEKTLDAMNLAGISRADAVVALGGGVVGDLAGFAAAVHLRGIRVLQIPTTLLAMIDSSVGGKTGVNSAHGKNLIGAFHQPAGVLIDPEVLRTLPKRELTSGLCEAVKHAAISGSKLLNKTGALLELRKVGPEDAFFGGELESLIAENVRFKAKIVAGDERESVAKTDARSRKILNFGHTFAHALERATNYRYLKHGEAVGYGILFAAELSKKLEMLSGNELKLLNAVVQRAGKLPPLDGIDREKVLAAFSKDKKNIGNELQWILLQGLGKPVVFPGSKIPSRVIRDTLRTVISK